MIESPWPSVHFEHSHWWKTQSGSKFAASHYVWGTDRVCMWTQDGWKGLHGFLHGIERILFHGRLDFFLKILPLGGRPRTKPGNHGTLNVYNCWFILFYHVWGPAWIEIRWNTTIGWGPGHIWLHTTLGGPRPRYMILEVSWDGTFFWALRISWSRRLVCVWSGPKRNRRNSWWRQIKRIGFWRPTCGSNIWPMSRVYDNGSFKPLILTSLL